MPKLKALNTDLAREINRNKRTIRRRKRGLTGGIYELRRMTVRSLSELAEHPMRPGLAVQVAMNIANAGA